MQHCAFCCAQLWIALHVSLGNYMCFMLCAAAIALTGRSKWHECQDRAYTDCSMLCVTAAVYVVSRALGSSGCSYANVYQIVFTWTDRLWRGLTRSDSQCCWAR